MFDDPFRFSNRYVTGNLTEGMYGLLLSTSCGLFLYSPFLLTWFGSFLQWVRRDKRNAIVCLASIFSYLLVMGWWIDWRGGAGFGPRLIVPIIGLMYYPIALFPTWQEGTAPYVRIVTFIAILISVLNMFPAVFFNDFLSDRYPLLSYIPSQR